MYYLLIPAFLLLILGLAGYYFHREATRPTTVPYDHTFHIETEQQVYNREAFEVLEKEELYLTMEDGSKLHGYFIKRNPKKLVVLAHGFSWSLSGAIKYMNLFLDRDFSVFIYDHRNHGKSSKSFTSFGYFESRDLCEVLAYFKKRLGEDLLIGLHGESMGGATVLQTAVTVKDLAFVVADCPFYDAREAFYYRIYKDYKLKLNFLVPIANLWTLALQGWSFRRASVMDTYEEIQVPVLLFHGDADEFLPKEMSLWLHDHLPQSSLCLIKGADHAESIRKDPSLYEKTLDDFLKRVT